ncbi:MAG: 8-oxo-dGTP pyrophosphatase MutT (NUDIX family) [Phycisphaerales bacterium]
MSDPSNTPTNLPIVRTDLIDVYVFRHAAHGTELLQLRRVEADEGHDLHGTWQPVMGHIENHETPAQTAARELEEETGLCADSPDCKRLIALEGIHPYYLPSRNAIMMSPRFACEAALSWEPTLNHEHDAVRWIAVEQADEMFMWPGQRACIAELLEILSRGPC